MWLFGTGRSSPRVGSRTRSAPSWSAPPPTGRPVAVRRRARRRRVSGHRRRTTGSARSRTEGRGRRGRSRSTGRGHVRRGPSWWTALSVMLLRQAPHGVGETSTLSSSPWGSTRMSKPSVTTSLELDLCGHRLGDRVLARGDQSDDSRPVGESVAPAADQADVLLGQRHRVERGGLGVQAGLDDRTRVRRTRSGRAQARRRPGALDGHVDTDAVGEVGSVSWNPSAVGSMTGPMSSDRARAARFGLGSAMTTVAGADGRRIHRR